MYPAARTCFRADDERRRRRELGHHAVQRPLAGRDGVRGVRHAAPPSGFAGRVGFRDRPHLEDRDGGEEADEEEEERQEEAERPDERHDCPTSSRGTSPTRRGGSRGGGS